MRSLIKNIKFVHLFFNNLNIHHKSSWHYQEFTYQKEPLSLTPKVLKLSRPYR